MGVVWDLYLGASLNDGPGRIRSWSILSSQLRRELDTCSSLPLSTNHPMVLITERDDFFGADSHGDTTLSRGISKNLSRNYAKNLKRTMRAVFFWLVWGHVSERFDGRAVVEVGAVAEGASG